MVSGRQVQVRDRRRSPGGGAPRSGAGFGGVSAVALGSAFGVAFGAAGALVVGSVGLGSTGVEGALFTVVPAAVPGAVPASCLPPNRRSKTMPITTATSALTMTMIARRLPVRDGNAVSLE